MKPKKELPSITEKKKVLRKRSNTKSRKNNCDQEPEFEIIQEKDLTTSTVIETTDIPPLEKKYNDDDDYAEDWRIVNNPKNDSKIIIEDSFETSQEQKPDGPRVEEIEVIQVLDEHSNNLEGFSDSSSTCSFDVIDENKNPRHISEVNEEENVDITEMKFHLDFPTLVALFCVTTALGFVIGHGTV